MDNPERPATAETLETEVTALKEWLEWYRGFMSLTPEERSTAPVPEHYPPPMTAGELGQFLVKRWLGILEKCHDTKKKHEILIELRKIFGFSTKLDTRGQPVKRQPPEPEADADGFGLS